MPINQFFLPYRPAYDAAGISVPGAKLYFTEAGGTNTPMAIYEDDALAVELSNPVVADGAGQFPPIYLQNDEYRVRIYGRNAEVGVDTPYEEYDPYLPGVLVGTVVGNESSVVTSLVQLAALTGTVGSAVYLDVDGRQGWFSWSAANLSTQVTADAPVTVGSVVIGQGIYVAPASTPTGAAGAWVRKFSGPALSLWWGVSEAGTAAANVAAYNAALATLKAIALTGYGYNTGGIGLHTPAGHYSFNAALTPTHALEQSGDYTGGLGSGGGTVFEWTSATTHGFDCLGGNGVSNRAAGGTIRGFYLLGAYAGTEGEYHAIHFTGKMNLIDCAAVRWPGDGFGGDAQLSSNNGSINGSHFQRLSGQECRYTIQLGKTLNDDTNGCVGIDISAISNRRGLIADMSFLGNYWSGGVCEPCSPLSTFKSRCYNNGHIFIVAYGQEAGAAANSPPATATSNTWWLYLGDAAASAAQPQWTGGQTWYFAAPIVARPDNDNSFSRFVGIHLEAGQNPVVLANNCSYEPISQSGVLVWTATGLPHGGFSRGGGQNMIFNNGVQAFGGITGFGVQHFFGPVSGAVADTEIYLNNTNVTSGITFQHYTAGVPTVDAHIFSTVNALFLNSVAQTSLRINNANKAVLTATAFDLAAGVALTINAVQVVGPRSTGWTADTGTAKKTATATYAPGANLTYGAAYVQAEQTATSTRLQLIEPALRDATQEIKAIKDALIAHGLIGA